MHSPLIRPTLKQNHDGGRVRLIATMTSTKSAQKAESSEKVESAQKAESA